MQKQRKLKLPSLPKGFKKGVKKASGDFLWGVWDGTGTPRTRADRLRGKKRSERPLY